MTQIQEKKIPKWWIETTLWEVCEIIMWQSPKWESYNIIWDWIPFYQWVTEFWSKYVSIKTYTNQPTKVINSNTLLFSVRAPVWRVNFTQHKSCIGRWNAWLIMKNWNQEFLYYLLIFIQKEIINRSSWTVFDSISWKELKEIPLVISKNSIGQQAIAKILSSFDDKIELLREQNETLEKIWQEIFKEWFGKYKVWDDLPKGWRIGKLSEIADFLNWLALQKYPAKPWEKSLPVIKIRELKQGITENTDRANFNLDKKYIIKTWDVLFSWSWSLEVVIWKYWKWALNQHLFKVSSKKYPKWFYYLWTLYHLEDFRNTASNKATTMWHIQRWHLDLAEVIIPDDKQMLELNKIFEPIIQKFEDINLQIQTLSKTRDELLPRLMKGDVLVNNL